MEMDYKNSMGNNIKVEEKADRSWWQNGLRKKREKNDIGKMDWRRREKREEWRERDTRVRKNEKREAWGLEEREEGKEGSVQDILQYVWCNSMV